jgi:hypothetical protein
MGEAKRRREMLRLAEVISRAQTTHGAEHLAPVFDAVRNHGIGLMGLVKPEAMPV